MQKKRQHYLIRRKKVKTCKSALMRFRSYSDDMIISIYKSYWLITNVRHCYSQSARRNASTWPL